MQKRDAQKGFIRHYVHHCVDSAGFTLIEALVYLALFTLIMSGAFAGAYQIVEHSNRTRVEIAHNEELQFLLRKMEWALGSASDVTYPERGDDGERLEVTGSYGTLRFRVEDGVLTLNDEPLSGEYVTIADFAVSHETSPEQVTLSVSFEEGSSATTTVYMYE
jgi:type II secretory pathway component PulJ